jgi:acetoacetyl-CoA synthetase
MWNYLVSGLLVGATVVTYDGSPLADDSDRLWALAERHEVGVLGVSPAYLQGSARAGRDPGTEHDLAHLRLLGVTGSVLPPASFDWVAAHVGPRVQLVSTTGGTDVVTGFAGGAPTVPVYRGEISARCLGVALYAWDAEGKPVTGEVGELVITRPMPSMPVGFWNDPDGVRYRDAYFDMYPGVWRHGDWVTVTEHGGIVVHGRSDSTLNRHGIRMGSADIYSVVERRDDIVEALVIGAELPDGSYWMPLFVVLPEGRTLTPELVEQLKAQIRAEASPRHVPDEVLQIPAVPHTRTGKKLEVPVKRLLQGAPLETVVNPGSVDDPGLLDYFTSLARRRGRSTSVRPGG